MDANEIFNTFLSLREWIMNLDESTSGMALNELNRIMRKFEELGFNIHGDNSRIGN